MIRKIETCLWIVLCLSCVAVYYIPYRNQVNVSHGLENDITNQKIQIFDLQECIYKIPNIDQGRVRREMADLTASMGLQKKNILFLRIHEGLCMNCYFSTLAQLTEYFNKIEKEGTAVVVLGGYRFNATFKQLMADLGLDGHMGYNPKLSLDYDDLDCPYLYYLDTGNDTSSLYLIQKGENPKMEDYLNKIKEM